MKKLLFIISLISIVSCSFAEGRDIINLNGTWSFDQTETAFPPKKFTRTIPVPGLITLAQPRISQYDKLFTVDDTIPYGNYKERGYTPMYNWYYKKIYISDSLKSKKVTLNILKSMYVTTIYINGRMVENSTECYTPIMCNISDFLNYGQENEILIMVGDRAFLPSGTAGGTDTEKTQYTSGIWDDVFLTVTGEVCVHKALFLPSLKNHKVTVKTLIRNLYPASGFDKRSILTTEFSTIITLKEKNSGKIVATKTIDKNISEADNLQQFETTLEVNDPHAWSPEDPFLYTGEIEIKAGDRTMDRYSDNFGIRDFEAVGRYFHLNGEKYLLRGSNVTLHRFFQDVDCGNLPWNREWVKKMLIDNPKSIDWNAMRICIGLVPDFWYDLCDEYGILLQNEWMYWNYRGWNDQFRKEYTNWVWSDGNHASIVIWDAINENVNDYVGHTLIKELKELDNTRIWDQGYMLDDDMDEPHAYVSANTHLKLDTEEKLNDYFDHNVDRLGALDYWDLYPNYYYRNIPQIVNEYGWSWLTRDGKYTELSKYNYRYYLGENSTADQRREFQAYWLQTETEWLRARRNLAGLLCFGSLTYNNGVTGDWYINNIRDLEMSPAYKWFRHCFAPEAVFIDLADSRYTKHVEPLVPDDNLAVILVGVNDNSKSAFGNVTVNIYNSEGSVVFSLVKDVAILPYGRQDIPVTLKIPGTPGGYLITAEYTPKGKTKPYICRRFVKVGKADSYKYYEIKD